jgi:sugar phosphate isomerase/epimerase
MKNNIEFAVSLYGFTQRLIEYPGYGIEDMCKELNSLGIKKCEIIGTQVFSQYPTPPGGEIEEMKSLFKQYGIVPYSYGGYVDLGKETGHEMTEEEMLQEILFDMAVARDLGCQCLRDTIPPSLVKQVARAAEVSNIRVGIEVHAPSKPSDPDIQAYAKIFEELKSPWVGFVPDFGCFIERPNEIGIQKFIEKGAKRELLDFIIQNRHGVGYTFESMWEKLQTMGGGEAEHLAAADWFGYMSFGPADLEGFKTILPYVIYFHGKFYHIGGDCVETTIPYEELLKAIVDSGFNGVLLSEYEGHAFDLDDAHEQIERHLIMEKNIFSKL